MSEPRETPAPSEAAKPAEPGGAEAKASDAKANGGTKGKRETLPAQPASGAPTLDDAPLPAATSEELAALDAPALAPGSD